MIYPVVLISLRGSSSIGNLYECEIFTSGAINSSITKQGNAIGEQLCMLWRDGGVIQGSGRLRCLVGVMKVGAMKRAMVCTMALVV